MTLNIDWSTRNGCVKTTGIKGRVGAVRVDLDRVHEPVGVFEVARIVLDVGFARICLGGASGVGGPDISGPVSAEGGVEDLGI